MSQSNPLAQLFPGLSLKTLAVSLATATAVALVAQVTFLEPEVANGAGTTAPGGQLIVPGVMQSGNPPETYGGKDATLPLSQKSGDYSVSKPTRGGAQTFKIDTKWIPSDPNFQASDKSIVLLASSTVTITYMPNSEEKRASMGDLNRIVLQVWASDRLSAATAKWKPLVGVVDPKRGTITYTDTIPVP